MTYHVYLADNSRPHDKRVACYDDEAAARADARRRNEALGPYVSGEPLTYYYVVSKVIRDTMARELARTLDLDSGDEISRRWWAAKEQQ